MDKSLHKVGDLPARERSAVEAILGRSLRDDQQLYIVVVDAAVEPSHPVRYETWNELEQIIAESYENVRQSGFSQEVLDRTIDQTCDEVRYRQ